MGVLDVDSTRKGAFNAKDALALESIVKLIF
jgi:putative methionine-R-sulfoxide reductase with GAF domain